MKFEKINEKKLRITYSINELESRNIDPKQLISNSDEAEGLILDIVESLEDRFDFDISATRLMIEASSTPANDFVVTITSLEDEEKGISENIITKKFLKLKAQKQELEKNEDKNVIIKFDSLDNTIAFANAILGRYRMKSELYKIKSDYYLNILPIGKLYLDRTSLLRISSDFGSYVSNVSVFEGYLKEHAKLILSRQAVQRLVKDF